VLIQIVDVQGAQRVRGLPLAGAERVGDQRGDAVHVGTGAPGIALDRLGRRNLPEQPPQEPDIHVMQGTAHGQIVKLAGGHGF